MDVSIAIIQIRSDAISLGQTSAHNYDVIVVDEPSTSYRVQDVICSKVVSLPKVVVSQEEKSVSEAVLRKISATTRRRYRRAVEIPLWRASEEETARHSRRRREKRNSMSGLVVIPLNLKEGIPISGGRFESLSRLLHIATRESEKMETQTQNMVRRIDEWLQTSHRVSPTFLSTLFLRPSAVSRVKRCSHNPSYGPHDSWNCINVRNSPPGTASHSADINHEVVRINSARLRMIKYEKFEIFVMNPIFGTGLDYRTKDEAPAYFARGVTENRKNSEEDRTSLDSPRRYALHKAAYSGDSILIQNLLAQGEDPNELDRDSWTPLHYAAFYGHLDATRALIQGAHTDVNAQNKGGATALHFAALNANAYLVELILSHPKIDTSVVNKDGHRAVDLCRNVPKKEWQEVARLLDGGNKAKKIQIDFVDLSNLMVELTYGADTTAGDILHLIGNELGIPPSARPLFSLWVTSERLSVQLKADHKPLAHLNARKWKEKVEKWSTFEECSDNDRPHLVMQRNALCGLPQEQQAILNERALSLLYEEARQLYLRGFYPCNETDSYILAAIILKIIYGANHRLSEPNLKVILPQHREQNTDKSVLINAVTREYKLLKTANITLLQQQFLKVCWTLSVYGSTFFEAEVYMIKPFSAMLPVHFGVNDYAVHLINSETKKLCNTYPLKGLSWVNDPKRSYLEIKYKSLGHEGHEFILRTPQTSHIHMLLSRLCGKDVK